MHHFRWREIFLVFLVCFLLFGCSEKQDKTPQILDKGFLVPTRVEKRPTAELSTFPPPTATVVESGKPAFPNDIKSRAGFGLSENADPKEWAEQLGAGWYVDWLVKDIPPGSIPAHWQTVRVTNKSGAWSVFPSQKTIQQIAKKNPGTVWIIGNEPDVIWQDNIPAEIYAEAYHDLFQLLNQVDPDAVIAPAGIAQATDIRLAYLDKVLAEYQRRYSESMPADLWTVHGYVLREEKGSWGVDIPPGFDYDIGMAYEVSDHGRMDLFTQQLIAFRSWMSANGYRNKPLALTEFGILMPPELGFSTNFTANYLKETYYWLATAADPEIGYPMDNNRLVQYWAWFSLSDKLYPAANLGDLKNNKLTVIGKACQDFMADNQIDGSSK